MPDEIETVEAIVESLAPVLLKFGVLRKYVRRRSSPSNSGSQAIERQLDAGYWRMIDSLSAGDACQ
jgi:hypothetical protein